MEALQLSRSYVAVWAMAGGGGKEERGKLVTTIRMPKQRALLGLGYSTESSTSSTWRVSASPHIPNYGHQGEDSASTSLHATGENANDVEETENGTAQRYGSSEAHCDDGSSFLAVERVLDTEGGNSVEDYKFRANIFAKSAIFFAALKDLNNGAAK